MIQSSVTISLVPEIKCGPFIFTDGLESGCVAAANIGFDSVEVLVPAPEAMNATHLKKILNNNNLQLAAIGTGAGFVVRKLHLCSSEKNVRQKALEFISQIIDFAGPFGAKTIIGSMKGFIEDGVNKSCAKDWLCEALNKLGSQSAKYNIPLLLEPLNRYETNFINRLEEGVKIIESLETDNVRLLADLFHMNIEEQSIENALSQAANYIGHIHFVDSNRRPAGFGHLDFFSIAEILNKIGYEGFLSAEALPWPDSETAAKQTIEIFRKYIAKT